MAPNFGVFNSVIEGNGLIAGILAKGCASYSRKQTDNLIKWVKDPQIGGTGLVFVKYNEDGSVKSSVDKFYSEEHLRRIGEHVGS